ncbi:MAG: HEAT repeat domain-containing protein [Candidatus Latescibacteria bacterium]|nr:HEAT repeat domain-containing protein [Candidatus Latescibacterota bacterium]
MRGLCWLGMAILALGVLGCGSDNKPDVATLKQRFIDGKKSQADRVAAGRLLLQDNEGKSFVVAQYWTPQQRVVQALVNGLTQTQPDLAAQLLTGLMARAEGEEKLHFESQLIALGSPAIPALVELAHEAVDWQTAMQTLDALGKLKAPEGLIAMRIYLSHKNDWVRIAAAHALGDVGGRDAVEALVEALADTSDTVVAAALIGLGKTGEPQAVEKCAVLLNHPNARLRGAAVSAIGRLGGVDARRLLEPMVNDDDSGVRYKAGQALKRLN